MDTGLLLTSPSRYSTLPTATSVLWATDGNISDLEDFKHWHRDHRLLFDFSFLSTSGAAASFLLQSKPKRGELANGKAAWDDMVRKYQDSTRQRRRILKQQLTHMVMTDGQDPDVFMNELYYLRDELVDMGEKINDRTAMSHVPPESAYQYIFQHQRVKALEDCLPYALQRTISIRQFTVMSVS